MQHLKKDKLTLFFLFFLCAPYSFGGDLEHICGPYYLKSQNFFSSSPFNSNDKKLICGTDTPGWKNVPLNQAMYQIGSILEDKGHYQWEYNQKEDQIIVDPGKLFDLQKIEYINAPDAFFEETFIGVDDDTISSSLLDKIKSWSLQRMQAIGYPCPNIDLRASYKENKVIVDITPGTKRYIHHINREEKEGLRSNSLSRYDAIQSGDLYNRDFLSLTTRRMYADRVVNYAYFETQCNQNEKNEDDNEEFSVDQNIILDKPNSVVLAAGASSEEFPLFKAKYQRSRLDKNASTLSTQLYLSSVIQSFSTDFRLYLFNDLPRLYFNPNFEIKRQDEDAYESIFQKYQMAMAYSFDSSSFQINTKLAPTYNVEKNFESEETSNVNYLSLDGNITITDHYYEYYRISPRTGYQLNFSWSSQQKGLGSDFSGNQYRINGKYLFNIGFLDPPILVLGARFDIATVDVDSLDLTPQRMRLYLGGNQDIRGFNRKSINNFNRGFLTTAYIGFESRLVSVLPFNLQPYLLFDIAKVGKKSFALSKALLYSPGIGLRWEGPIGNFRVSLAKGKIENKDSSITSEQEGLTLFFSYGQEF